VNIILFNNGILLVNLQSVAMKKSSNILKNCFNCILILPIFSVLFFALFMGYSASLNIENSSSNKIISGGNENIKECGNIEFSETANSNLPVRNPNIDSQCIHYFIFWDLDDEFNNNNEHTKPLCDNLSTKAELNGLTRKYFVIQIISKNILPTQRALRSDVLLI
jgi:hypothetical protein